MYRVKSEAVRVQKSIFGYNYNQVRSRVHEGETMGGSKCLTVCLRHGIFVCHFRILKLNDGCIFMQSGKLHIKLIKRG
jgi:hypothetical protein